MSKNHVLHTATKLDSCIATAVGESCQTSACGCRTCRTPITGFPVYCSVTWQLQLEGKFPQKAIAVSAEPVRVACSTTDAITTASSIIQRDCAHPVRPSVTRSSFCVIQCQTLGATTRRRLTGTLSDRRGRRSMPITSVGNVLRG